MTEISDANIVTKDCGCIWNGDTQFIEQVAHPYEFDKRICNWFVLCFRMSELQLVGLLMLDCLDKTWRQKSCFFYWWRIKSVIKPKSRIRCLYKRWTSMSNRNGFTVTHGYALIACILFKIVRISGDMMSRTRIQNPRPEAKLALASKWLCDSEQHTSAVWPNFWHNWQRTDDLEFDL